MNLLEAIVYGLLQGLGEFLPISSSAHLVLVPWLFGWHDPGLTFDIALHFGTLIAVVAYFWRDWWGLIIKGFSAGRSDEGRLFWYLVIATIPGAIGGFLLEKKAETAFRDPLLIAAMLAVMGLLLYGADRFSPKKKGLKDLSLFTSLAVGISQVLAIIPGVSRSGVTMATGLTAGLTRETAARFSFLLSTPVILGAALVKVPHLLSDPGAITTNFVVAVTVSCLSGLLSIGFLLRYLAKRGFLPFVVYRLLLSALVIIVVLMR
jgi:undecaprenyl-diphosphatase